MAKNTVPRGETSVIRHVFIMDSSSTTGAGLTALAYNTASLTGYYLYPGGTAASLTLEDITTLGTYAAPTSAAHIRFKKVDDTNMPGWYELHFHNDWFSVANGRRAACVQLKGATNMAPLNLEIDCIGMQIQSVAPDVDVETIKGQAITCSAGVTVGAYVGNATAALSVSAAGRVDVGLWLGTACATPSVAGVPEVDLTYVNGSAVTGGATVDANVVSISGDTTAADNCELFFDGTGYAGTNNVIPTVTTVNGFGNGAIKDTSFAAGAITDAAIASSAISDAKIATGAITSAKFAAGAITDAVVATNAINADALAADAVSEIASQVATTLGTGSGFTALAPASTALSTLVWTDTKAGYLDAAVSEVAGATTISITTSGTIIDSE